MPYNPKSKENLRPAAKGDVRNPNGKPKGTINLSTHIQNLLNDENFNADILDAKGNKLEYKGMPVIAIIQTAVRKALGDSDKSIQYMEWLAKYGYGTNVPDSPEELHVTYEVVNRIPEPKEE